MARNSEFRHGKADSTYMSRGGVTFFFSLWEARRGGQGDAAAASAAHVLLSRKISFSLLPHMSGIYLCMSVV
jgi:hypothetical protein